MRCEIVLAAALTALSAMSATAARAESWCGYAAKENAMIECGYSTAAECENTIGKGAMCFIDPNYARNEKRFTPAFAVKLPAGHG